MYHLGLIDYIVHLVYYNVEVFTVTLRSCYGHVMITLCLLRPRVAPHSSRLPAAQRSSIFAAHATSDLRMLSTLWIGRCACVVHSAPIAQLYIPFRGCCRRNSMLVGLGCLLREGPSRTPSRTVSETQDAWHSIRQFTR